MVPSPGDVDTCDAELSAKATVFLMVAGVVVEMGGTSEETSCPLLIILAFFPFGTLDVGETMCGAESPLFFERFCASFSSSESLISSLNLFLIYMLELREL